MFALFTLPALGCTLLGLLVYTLRPLDNTWVLRDFRTLRLFISEIVLVFKPVLSVIKLVLFTTFTIIIIIIFIIIITVVIIIIFIVFDPHFVPYVLAEELFVFGKIGVFFPEAQEYFISSRPAHIRCCCNCFGRLLFGRFWWVSALFCSLFLILRNSSCDGGVHFLRHLLMLFKPLTVVLLLCLELICCLGLEAHKIVVVVIASGACGGVCEGLL